MSEKTKSLTINGNIRDIIVNMKKIKMKSYEQIFSEYINNKKDFIAIIKNTNYKHDNLKQITIPNMKELEEIKTKKNISLSYLVGIVLNDYLNNIKVSEYDLYEIALSNKNTQDFLLKRSPKRKYVLEENKLIIKKDFNNFKYEDKELKLINETIKFNDEDIIKINKLKSIYSMRQYSNYLEDMYALYVKYNYSTVDMSIVYGFSPRTIQAMFKKCNIIKSKFEAQQIAKNKRDYKQIMNKSRETMMKNQTSLKGSKPEIYTRDYINCRLPLEIPNLEIIVGVNNKSILDGGKEIDIPIIIINNDKIYKFAIEYNGDFWHENKNRESIKLEMINNKGYHLFYIAPKPQASNKQIKEHIEEQVDNVIIPYIKNKLNELEEIN